MVLSWNSKQIVKKKYVTSHKDKRDWEAFTKQISDIHPKEGDLLQQNIKLGKIKKLDLHGSSLNEANRKVKEFVNESFNQGYRKLLIITGKGLRSKSHDNPYLSEKLSVLKYAIPEYIQNDEDLKHKVGKISKAELKDGGEGAIYIFLKNSKSL